MTNSFTRRRPFATLVMVAAVGLVAAGAAGGARAEEPPCLRPPVAGIVTDPFRRPACVWCAGNRGVEYRVDDRTAVRAAASGTVVYVGTVVDTRYVVVELINGWRLTYGHVDDVEVQLGSRVAAGSVIGRASGSFHFGLRIADEYADPVPFIGRLVGRTRLVPVDGSPPRPSRDEHARCRVAGTSR